MEWVILIWPIGVVIIWAILAWTSPEENEEDEYDDERVGLYFGAALWPLPLVILLVMLPFIMLSRLGRRYRTRNKETTND